MDGQDHDTESVTSLGQKGHQREPKGDQREPKAHQGGPKVDQKEPKENQKDECNMSVEVVGDRITEGGDVADNAMEGKVTQDGMMNAKNAGKHNMKKKVRFIDDKEIYEKMFVK